jgi:hypothetical protein
MIMGINVNLLKDHCENYINAKSSLCKSLALEWIKELAVKPHDMLELLNEFEQIKTERDMMKRKLNDLGVSV